MVLRRLMGDFSGGSVVKNLPSNAGNASSIPGQGTKIPCAVGATISPCAAVKESVHHNEDSMQINIFKRRRKRLTGLHTRCQFDSVHPGGSRGNSLFCLSYLLDAACIPWFMVSYFIFKVSSLAIFKCLSLIFLSLSLSLTPALLFPSYKVSNPICQKPSYWIPLNTLPTTKPVLSTPFCFSTHDK